MRKILGLYLVFVMMAAAVQARTYDYKMIYLLVRKE